MQIIERINSNFHFLEHFQNNNNNKSIHSKSQRINNNIIPEIIFSKIKTLKILLSEKTP